MYARRFHVFRVRARVADVGIRQGYDLPAVGGIRQDFLVTGHRGVEDDFADSLAVGADRCAPKNGSVLQSQNSWRTQMQSSVRISQGSPSQDRAGRRCTKAEGHCLPLIDSPTAQRSGVVYLTEADCARLVRRIFRCSVAAGREKYIPHAVETSGLLNNPACGAQRTVGEDLAGRHAVPEHELFRGRREDHVVIPGYLAAAFRFVANIRVLTAVPGSH